MDLSHLNPPQREAVLHGTGPLLVLAGAGSGKTRVITTRIAHLVRQGIPGRCILGVTFTNRAAEEMRERVALLVGAAEAKDLHLSTFHALGLSILKKERRALGFPTGFTIYDTSDQLGVIRECLREVRVADRRFDVKAILMRISRVKNAMVAVEAGEELPQGAAGLDDDDEYDEITRQLFPRYQRALRAFAAVDFDDLITEPVRLITTMADVQDRWASRFRYLLVDEYQDTNPAQLRLIHALSCQHDNVTVVGDDDQSIYAWRGADARNILGFDRQFPGATIVKLEQNYRSTSTILAAANAVILHNAERHGKTLWSDGDTGAPITSVACADAEAEARFVVDELAGLSDRGARWQDTAILYRSNAQARPLEEALREARIPYDLIGGQKFFDRKEVKDVIAYLKVALNPRDEIALRRVINYPARGIGTTTLERLIAASQAASEPLFSVLETVEQVFQSEEAGGRARKTIAAVKDFVTLVQTLGTHLESGAVGQALDLLLAKTALVDDLRQAAPNPKAADRRVAAVEDLRRSLVAYATRKPGRKALADYLRLMTLSNRDEETVPGDKLTLSTIHGAKGLEWPIVFLVGMEEDFLPHLRTLAPTASDMPNLAEIAEERRLAYVAITRARETLYLSRARHRKLRGRDIPRTPSRFLLDIPSKLLSTRDIEAEDRLPADMDKASEFFKSFFEASG